MQLAEQVDALGGGVREADTERRHHTIVQTQFVAALELESFVFVYKDTVTGGDAHPPAV